MHSVAFQSAVAFATASLVLAGCKAGDTVEPAPASMPPPSAGHALVYHDSLAAVLLLNAGLGGPTAPSISTPTVLWRWTGQGWDLLDSLGPPIRNLAGVAYDSRRNALVLYGGTYDLGHTYDETWEWDQTDGWQRRNVTGPGRRDHTEATYDADRGQVVLFGGQIGTDSFPSDTWIWDGVSCQQIATSGPPGRVHHTLVYDPIGRRVLAFGGYNPSIGELGDTWAWSGTAWSAAAPAVTPRTHARLGVLSRGIILLGGFPVQAASSVLLLENGAWRSDVEPGAPNQRYLTALAFDPLRNVTVLFGGGDPSSGALYADTWEFEEASGWRRVQ